MRGTEHITLHLRIPGTVPGEKPEYPNPLRGVILSSGRDLGPAPHRTERRARTPSRHWRRTILKFLKRLANSFQLQKYCFHFLAGAFRRVWSPTSISLSRDSWSGRAHLLTSRQHARRSVVAMQAYEQARPPPPRHCAPRPCAPRPALPAPPRVSACRCRRRRSRSRGRWRGSRSSRRHAAAG